MRGSRRVCAVLLAAVALVAGCARVLDIREDRYLVEAGPGTCEGTILIRSFFDLTGSTSDTVVASSKGFTDYLRDLDARGGVRGCNVEVTIDDTHYDPEQALAVYDGWRKAPDFHEVSTIIGAGTPIVQRVAPLTASDRKVFLTASYSGEFATPAPLSHDLQIPTSSDSFAQADVPVTKRSPGYPTVFFPGTDYTTTARIAMQHAWRQGAKRVAFFYCSTSGFCTDPVDGAKSFLATLGQTAIGRELIVELDESEQSIGDRVVAFFRAELAHKQKNPAYQVVDWIWFGNTRLSLARVGKALARVKTELGLTVSVVTNTWGVDEGLFAACGDACVGFMSVQPLPIYGDGSVTGMKDLVRVHDTYRTADGDAPDAYRTVPYVAGYVVAALWERAAFAVVDARKPLTGDNLRAALETFANVDIAGFANVSFSPTDHRPQASGRIYRLGAGGALQAAGQPIVVPQPVDGLGW